LQGQDLASGNLTAPAVYALAHPTHGPELEALVQREFDGGASLPRALELVHLGGGIQAARRLARQEADLVSQFYHTSSHDFT
jgi:all-trans-nonaprenyl-diphosphate synthase